MAGAIEAGSLEGDRLAQRRGRLLAGAIEAGSLLVQAYYIVGLVPFVDRLNQEVNHCSPL